MEVHAGLQSAPTSPPSSQDGARASVSKELLSAGSGGSGGTRRVAAAWRAHVWWGARAQAAGEEVGASCLGPAPLRGDLGVTAGLQRASSRGVGGWRGARPRGRGWFLYSAH